MLPFTLRGYTLILSQSIIKPSIPKSQVYIVSIISYIECLSQG